MLPENVSKPAKSVVVLSRAHCASRPAHAAVIGRMRRLPSGKPSLLVSVSGIKRVGKLKSGLRASAISTQGTSQGYVAYARATVNIAFGARPGRTRSRSHDSRQRRREFKTEPAFPTIRGSAGQLKPGAPPRSSRLIRRATPSGGSLTQGLSVGVTVMTRARLPCCRTPNDRHSPTPRIREFVPNPDIFLTR